MDPLSLGFFIASPLDLGQKKGLCFGSPGFCDVTTGHITATKTQNLTALKKKQQANTTQLNVRVSTVISWFYQNLESECMNQT